MDKLIVETLILGYQQKQKELSKLKNKIDKFDVKLPNPAGRGDMNNAKKQRCYDEYSKSYKELRDIKMFIDEEIVKNHLCFTLKY